MIIPIKRISPLANNSQYFIVGQSYQNKTVFKYMNLETALICINEGTLRLSEPDRWVDKYEGRFYNANYNNLKLCVTKDTPKLYACCFTYKKMSEAAWKAYNGDARGLRMNTVQFEIDVNGLRKQLLQNISSSDKVYEGRVDYSVSDHIIETLHKKSSCGHQAIVRNFDLKHYLTLLLLKRKAFSHEYELRLFLNKNGDTQKKQSFVDIPMDWKKVIKHINVQDTLSEIELLLLEKICQDKGINKSVIKKTSLYGVTKHQCIFFDP